MLTVSAFGGLIISSAQVSKGGGRLGSHPFFVYLGEVSYAVCMVCLRFEVLFVNLAVKILLLLSKHLPLPLRLILLVSVAPVATLAHHLIERPAREGIKLGRAAAHPHKLATAHAR
jgi:peptidoglycan/LPS O-acetylase OafA/YrhL